MDSSENEQDVPQEPPISPSEHEVDLADEEGFPPREPEAAPLRHEEPALEDSSATAPPLEPAEPGMYYCDAEDPGAHPKLGQLHHGENDFTGVTHPEELLAIASLVQDGVLKKV